MDDNNFGTDQEKFWAGQFGTDYIDRNKGDKLLAANLNFFAKSLSATRDLSTCIEFGANIGMNLKAIQLLYPEISCSAIEINADAAKELSSVIPQEQVHNRSIIDFTPVHQWDLVLIKGVLIHLNPDVLEKVYDNLFSACGRYLMVAEYYNPSPVAIPYRGHTDRLFKRDFAGEILDRFPALKLVDYGFAYRRDPSFPQDDISWFLMERR